MALLPVHRAAPAALPFLQKKTHLSEWTQRQLLSPSHLRDFFLLFSRNAPRASSFLSRPAASHQQQRGFAAAAAGLAKYCDRSRAASVPDAAVKTPPCIASPSLGTFVKSEGPTPGAAGVCNVLAAEELSKNGLFPRSFFPEEIWPAPSSDLCACGSFSYPGNCPAFVAESSSSSSTRTEAHTSTFSVFFSTASFRTKKAATCCISPAGPWICAGFPEKRTICSSPADLSSFTATTTRPTLTTDSVTAVSAPSSCSKHLATAAASSRALGLPLLSARPFCSTADATVQSSSLRFALPLLPRFSAAASSAAGAPSRVCTASLYTAAAPSLAFLSVSGPPLSLRTAAATPPAAVRLSLPAADVPLPLRTAAGAAATATPRRAVAAACGSAAPFLAAAPLGANSPCPDAGPTSVAWVMKKSERFLGARTRRQREEVERKAEQQRNSQLTAAQYSSHFADSGHQPAPYQSSYQQQVPPAGAASGLSLGWQLTIAFLSSIAFYVGFVMMMRLFGGHRVVAVHVDQYGRPVDPTTGQPRY